MKRLALLFLAGPLVTMGCVDSLRAAAPLPTEPSTIRAASTSPAPVSELDGTYIFVLHGLAGGANATSVGTFTADGNGHVTSGSLDVNAGPGSINSGIFGGTYASAAPNQFSLVFNLPTGPLTIPVFVGGVNSSEVATKLRAEVPVAGGSASGTFYLQNPDAATYGPGSFLIGLSGGTGSTQAVTVGRLDAGASGTIANGELDAYGQAIGGPVATEAAVPFSGALSPALTNNRGTITFNVGSTSFQYCYYPVSADEFLLLETDAAPTGVPIQSGMMLRQIGGASLVEPDAKAVPATTYGFTNSSLTGSSVYSLEGSLGATGSFASVGLFAFDGGTTVTSHSVQRVDGQPSVTTLAGLPYSVADNGRLIIGTAGSPALVGYVSSTGVALVASSANTLAFGSFEPQTATAITTQTLDAGEYLFGSTTPMPIGSNADAGLAALDGAGNITSYVLSDSSAGTVNSSGSPAATYSIDSTGLVTSSVGLSGYVVSPTRFLAVSPTGSYGIPIVFDQASSATTGPPSPRPTITSLSSSAVTATSGTTITLTATVSPKGATGTVNFYDGSVSIGSIKLSSVGTALLQASALPLGPQKVTAVYEGSAMYLGSKSPVVELAITPTDGASVATTANPIVAAYNLTLQLPGTVTVYFGTTTGYGFETSAQHFNAGVPATIYVAGMLQASTYHMHATIAYDNGETASDSDKTFVTGTLPPVDIPTYTVATTNGLTPQPGIELVDLLAGDTPGLPFAMDLNGNVIWNYLFPDRQVGSVLYPIKLLPNGHFMALAAPNSFIPLATPVTSATLNVIREFDLAGNVVRQLAMSDLNTALAAGGFNITLQVFSHDFQLLPNGHILVICNTLKPFTNLPGFPGVTTVLGDVVVDLDQNLKPVWLWNEFDHFDVNRHPYSFPDWTHTNAIVYSPDDGNFLVSIRHQNWIVKVDYKNGAGAGDVIWKLGYQGDFTLEGATDPTDWFYAQHDVNFVSSNTTGSFQVAIMDNGDDRVFPSGVQCGTTGAPACYYTTIMVMNVDENAKTASFKFHNFIPPTMYSFFAGDTRVQPNGNVEYNLAGVVSDAYVFEVTPTATPQTVWQMHISKSNTYRAFRIPSLYPGVQW